ncbi:MAG: acyltransferase [Deltaproteobacteria bacterium]|nr:acyltransferase [Deltaproteobacteria bacterium]
MDVMKMLKRVAQARGEINRSLFKMRLKKQIAQGLKIGKNCYILESVKFDYDYPFLIEIGDNVRIGPGVQILAHDASPYASFGMTRVAPVKILEGTSIFTDALILPGVTIGPNAMISARAVVNRDIGPNMAAAGNPARAYAKYPDLLKRLKQQIRPETIINIEDFESGKISNDEIRALVDEHSAGFIAGAPDAKSDDRWINTDPDYPRRQSLEALERAMTPDPETETE